VLQFEISNLIETILLFVAAIPTNFQMDSTHQSLHFWYSIEGVHVGEEFAAKTVFLEDLSSHLHFIN